MPPSRRTRNGGKGQQPVKVTGTIKDPPPARRTKPSSKRKLSTATSTPAALPPPPPPPPPLPPPPPPPPPAPVQHADEEKAVVAANLASQEAQSPSATPGTTLNASPDECLPSEKDTTEKKQSASPESEAPSEKEPAVDASRDDATEEPVKAIPEPEASSSSSLAGPEKKKHLTAGEQQQRQRALDLLRDEQQELPILYAALKVVKDLGGNRPWEETLPEMEADDLKLVKDACLAVPYLMYKRTCEGLMKPRTMGGLAFSDAKAQKTARDIFLNLPGLACVASTVSDRELMTRCPEIKAKDARKIVKSLRQIGKQARSRVDQIRTEIESGC